ncbi:thiolase-like protein [Ophiobolus disseminans]|uniref:beta-ketoacyl-[acyl-carrier-protein] synthase I n=1 Tax=Ophiobolus disseminans TaxID=1469910 RepID=A0A6A6ZTV9_9PLEO|nr:thiolase-like protein [Ophiobolus disseminans]
MKQTHGTLFREHDTANAISRNFLSLKKNGDEIYYVVQEEEAAVKDTVASPASISEVPQQTDSPADTPPPTIATGSIQDIPIQVVDIVRTIVSVVLKKPSNDVAFDQSIKALAGGRSTLQNEIIGDLDAEFGSVPDGAEELPLSNLCSALQMIFSGALGKRTKALADKFFNAKMPGGFGLSRLRELLLKDYGLGPGRQDAILLTALQNPPVARLGSESEAKAFWAGLVTRYASSTGLEINEVVNGPGAVAVAVDSKTLDALNQRTTDFHREIYDAYARHLSENSRAADLEAAQLRTEMRNMQHELDLWSGEHGNDYANGIKPSFDKRKVRLYDSAWNWAVQDLFKLYHSVFCQSFQLQSDEVVRRRHHIVNCSSERLLCVMRYLLQGLETNSTCPTNAKEWLEDLFQDCTAALKQAPTYRANSQLMVPRTTIDCTGCIQFAEVPATIPGVADNYKMAKEDGATTHQVGSLPPTPAMTPVSMTSATPNEAASTPESFISRNIYYPKIQQKLNGTWVASHHLSNQCADTLERALSIGLSFQGKNVLVTGAGEGSIGAHIVQGLLSSGARVIVTTSSYTKATKFYQRMYTKFGAKGSTLMVLPYNAGSSQDAETLVQYIYNISNADWDLDHIIPFAAISEAASGIELGPKSELAHRMMLTNVLRLLGAVKRAKETRHIVTRPAQVILPLSPNHGILGGDGLYSESKLGLEALLNKWHTEDWSNYLSVCGAIIGWTRGTSLMNDNNIVAEGVEALGLRTFSQDEMAMNVLGLMHSPVLEANQMEPVLADLSGGMTAVPNLKTEIVAIREHLSEPSSIRRSLIIERQVEPKTSRAASLHTPLGPLQRRANTTTSFPKLSTFESDVAHLSSLEGMVDLEKIVVVAGSGEIGPHGSSRTRWQMESSGHFTLEGFIEMAWMMGLIEYQSGESVLHDGWVSKESKKAIEDDEIKKKYEEHILKHSGIRLLDARALDGPDPAARQVLHEVDLQHDFAPFEVSRETAADLLREHGRKVTIKPGADEDTFTALLHKGARLMVPKSLPFDRTVGGQLPTGWSAKVYGVSDEIINQVDPATLYALVCTAEALLSAGVTDPYEFYKHIHVSQLGVCVGSGFGGAASLQGIYKERFLDKVVQNDVLAESFINTGNAWINMLLLGSCGPNITPVGACATALESLDVGVEAISSGKAKAVLVGGYDHLAKDVSYEFANMKATINSDNELKNGRQPQEMSRPATSTRSGFVESEGCGIQLLTTASLALEMGLPIHGIVALTRTACDGVGRSLPAPGCGTINFSGTSKANFDSPLLNMSYRKRQIERYMLQIKENEEADIARLTEEIIAYKTGPASMDVETYRQHRLKAIHSEGAKQRSDVLNRYGNDFWKRESTISPMQGALAVWGLTADDISVVSCHGTSTVKNELNECAVIQEQMDQLKRNKGNPLLAVFQKHLTGHPKGAAAAWMLNGALQIMDSGLIPGNRNADNIDSALEEFDHIVFPNETIHSSQDVKAVIVSAFGFGQKGAQAIVVHPKYLFAAAGKEVYETYKEKVRNKQMKADQYLVKGMITNTVFKAKNEPPYPKNVETNWLTNLDARLPIDMKL